MPELEITGQNHGERHSEHKAHAKAHNADQKDRAQTATVSMCLGEKFRDPLSAAATAYADPTHLVYQILIVRLHLSVALSRLCSTQQLQKISRGF